MKKMIICAAVVLAAMLSSCGDTKRCYEVTMTTNIAGTEVSSTTYYFMTRNDLDPIIKQLQQTAGDAAKITYHAVPKSQSDCK